MMLSANRTLLMPTLDGSLQPFTLSAVGFDPVERGQFKARIAYAAAHVVADPFGNAAGAAAVLDWEATLAFRRHLWSQGFGVAEAMDTAQRGMGLDWAAARELIRRTAAEARAVREAGSAALLACGAGTDHANADLSELEEVVAAYSDQIDYVEDQGATVILMASRQLVRVARSPDDYLSVYSQLLSQVRSPVILHWLGSMFDPQLAGYWGSDDIPSAIDIVADLIRANAGKVDGIKVSLLDESYERALRERLPSGVRLYTGDDFNYPSLITSGSHALLGIFDPIATVASRALTALDVGNVASCVDLFEPTVPLARHLFTAPTYFYKTGVTFLAWLAGYQSHFGMVNGLQSARSMAHLCEALRLADYAGLLPDADLAASRMSHLLEMMGVSA